MKSLADCRLYAFVDAAYLDGRAPAALAESLCQGGADIIQWRAKGWAASKVLETARELRTILQSHGVRLVINDHLDVAEAVHADLCHLGQEDFVGRGFQHVRELATPHRRIGLSTHAPDQALAAVGAGADYVAIGPVYATGTKPEARPVHLDYVRWAAANLRIPWFAIGGINLENLGDVLKAGARRVCVVSAILRAPDVCEACRAFKTRLTGA